MILSDRQLILTHLFAWKYNKDIQKAHWGQVKKSSIYGLVLRQEIRWLPSPPEKSDWRLISCRSKLLEENSRAIEGGSWSCLDHTFLILEVRRPLWLHVHRKAPWRSKEEWCQEIFYPYAFVVGSILAKRCVCTHGRILILRYTNMNCEPGKSKWLAKGKLDKCSI